MKPQKSYTIWFSVRTGSTLLSKALEGTGIAGRPNEWLLPGQYDKTLPPKVILENLWRKGTTDNGVFGFKFSMYNPCFHDVMEIFKQLPKNQNIQQDMEIWNTTFPNCHHIFMTRRNKVRLAVSWWRAIQSGEWGRKHGNKPSYVDIKDKYCFNAIHQLLLECTMREAGIQELFSQAGIVPLTLVYEDFILDYENTIKNVLNFLEIRYDQDLNIAEPFFDRITDDSSEEWVQRFRKEQQEDWTNTGW